MKKLITVFLCFVTILALLAGCASQAQTEPAKAGYKGTVKKLVIAYLPNEATEELAEVRGLMSKPLSKVLGIPVEEFNAADYNAVVEAMRTGKADMAYFGPLTYVEASERAKAEAMTIVANKGDKANAGYESLIIVKAKSKFQKIADLKGCNFAFVDPNSTSGNLIPTFEFMTAFPGTTNEGLHANGKFFTSVTFSGKHQNGLQAVVRGDVDAAPIASDILAREISAGNVKEADIRVIHVSPKIPASPMGIRGDLPQDLKDAILTFFLAYENDEYYIKMMGQKEGQKLRFIKADDKDYDYVRDLVKTVNK